MSRPAPAPLTVAEVCARLGAAAPGSLATTPVAGINTLELAAPDQASFITRPKFREAAKASRAGVIFIPARMKWDDARAVPVREVPAAVLMLLNHFHPMERPAPGVHPAAVVEPGAELAPGVSVGPFSIVRAGCRIGANTVLGAHTALGPRVAIGADSFLYDRVTIYADCRLGDRVLVHSGAVIGADGFKYDMVGGRLTKMPQVGIVVIEDDVEIGANTTIDRASFAETRVGARTKLDNAIQIGHNVIIGSDCVFAAHVAIGGSARIGRGVMMGGNGAIADNAVVGNGVKIAGMTGIRGEAPDATEWQGVPAYEARLFRKVWALNKKMPELYEKLKGEAAAPQSDDAGEE